MRGKLCIYICNSLVPEVSQILRNGDFSDVTLKSFPSVCLGCHFNNKKVLELASKDEEKYTKIIVIASCCKDKSQSKKTDNSKIEIVRLEQCFEIMFPLETIYHLAKEGNYLISNGWLRNYKRHIREWGFNEITSKAFFGESMKQLLLLDTGLPGE